MNVDFFKDKEFSKFHNVLDPEMKGYKQLGLEQGREKLKS